ncbi:MAG: bifunctional homocysteine S-methyltransferase/methylenetetrahydrofolate reductase [Anaerolineaceae bacterium]
MSNKFLDRLDQDPKPLVADGAMGTLLHERGVEFDTSFDFLNIQNPAIVAEIHGEYIQAGAEMIKTNTFSANRIKLNRYKMEQNVQEINRKAVQLARQVVEGSFKDVMIAGDIGPLGVPLAPFGRVQSEEAREIYREQMTALAKEGIDLLLIETFSDLYLLREAITAAREVDPTLPVIASMTFTRDKRTLLGDDPVKVANALVEYGADVIGVNCSGGPVQLLNIIKIMHAAQPNARISVMPNAGFPEQVGGRIMYPAGPAYFRDFAISFWKAGARVIGGCCGTTPKHIAVISETIQSANVEQIQHEVSIQEKQPLEVQVTEGDTSKLQEKLAAGKFVKAVEIDPPRGFSTHKLIAGASLLADAGADVIDVADSPMARMRMSPWGVCQLIQSQLKVETTLHFPTRGRNLLRVQGDLLAAHALGIRNVFVIMGDPTAIGDYPDAMDNYDLVPSGLIKLIKQGLNAGFDHAGGKIGQPTSFFVGGAVDLASENLEREVKLVHKKVEAGVDFLLSQPVFEPVKISKFHKAYEKEYGTFDLPILVGILPLASDRHARFLHNEVPGISIPETIQTRMEKASDQGAQQGVLIARDLIEEIRPLAQGVYFMPQFSRYDLVAEIIAEMQ